jgi:hypothetical protein
MVSLKKASAPLLLASLASPLLLNCAILNQAASVAGAGCPAVTALETGDFSTVKLQGDAKGELKGFLEAVYDVKKLSVETETSLIAACGELGKSLGMDEAVLKGEPADGEGAKKVCGGVSEKIKAMVNAAGDAKLVVTVTEPHCNIDIDSMLGCYQACGVTVDPGALEASCEGGEISGQCGGECKGSCTVEGAASCTGECDGNCTGKCDGKPMSEAGVCTGKCEGKCDAACKVTGKANCEGTCSGSCSATVKAPQCSGTFKPPSVDLGCQIGCSSKAYKMLKCQPPRVKVTAESKVKTDLGKLVKALEASLPKIIDIELGMGKRAQAQAEALVAYSAKMPSLAQAGGTQGVVCVANGTEVGQKALASLKASVNVSVSVKASASVSGSASAKSGG